MDFSFLANPGPGVVLPDPYERQQRQMSLAQAADTRKITQMKLDEYAREQVEKRGIGDAIGGIKNLDDDADVMRVLQSAPTEARAGIAKYINEQRKARADARKASATADETQFDVLRKKNAIVGGVAQVLLDNPNVSEQDFRAAAANLSRMGLKGDFILPPPGVDPRAHLQQIVGAATDADKQIQQRMQAARDAETKRFHTNSNALDEARLTETARNHRALEGNAAARLAVERTASAGTPQEISVDGKNTIAIYDKRTGTYTDANTRQPITGGIGPKTASSAALVGKMAENDGMLTKLDSAILLVESNPKAMGAKNMLGDFVRQRSDPAGIETRAAVADIGSQKIHDRSGAAVTISETPRLRPFIPDVNDTPQAAVIKLKRMRQEVAQMKQALANGKSLAEVTGSAGAQAGAGGMTIEAL